GLHVIASGRTERAEVTGLGVTPASAVRAAADGSMRSDRRRSVDSGEETTVSEWKTIVVGVDGSPGSRKALTWAAAEAADHGADLVVLNVWEHTLLPPAGTARRS